MAERGHSVTDIVNDESAYVSHVPLLLKLRPKRGGTMAAPVSTQPVEIAKKR